MHAENNYRKKPILFLSAVVLFSGADPRPQHYHRSGN
jgi:hypothetical protein